ncbi:MAG: DUF3106 domain-containing protein [Acidobacteriia bacterium]|nr:DUF3106 domain-containing protein [Terriglobia bacterium]
MRVQLIIAVFLLAMAPAALEAQKRAAVPKANRLIGPSPKLSRNQLDRIRNMTPQERKRMLNRLPPDKQRVFEERLDRFQHLTPQEQEKLTSQYEQFQQLPPEKKDAMRRVFRRFNQQPEERRVILREEMQSLRVLNEEDRRARMNSDEFRNKYNASEQQLLFDMSKAMREPEE